MPIMEPTAVLASWKIQGAGVHQDAEYNMGKITRWIAIVICLFMATAVLQAAPTQKKRTHPKTSHRATRRARHYRRRHYYRRRLRLPKEPSHDRTTQIQTALQRGGYYKGEPNGRWDANTIAAVQKFQSAHNLDATGKLDAPTLQKLGLGSDIAGVAAPKTVVPKDCCSAGPAVSTSAAPAKTSASAASASSAAAIAPSVNASASGTSAPVSAAKPDAAQH
jgi:Putative peptidoglycan binding domain